MVFSSIVFLLYFLPAFLVLYHLAGKRLKNIVILVSSIFFYSWGAPKFIFVLLGTTFIDFYLVKWMWKMDDSAGKKWLLTFSVCMNVGLLFYFKYSNFFIDNLNHLLPHVGMHTIQWAKLILPIGISFYTFETLTYVIDVYRKVHKPLDNFWDYQLYIILFPKLIAGPIIRYHEIADQITDRTANETIDNKLSGFYRFIIGLSKKVLIANALGEQANYVFGLKPHELTFTASWVGIICYTFQIYFDFSGYSDMAIGIGKMIGFKFPENFDNPYTSQSISEFWRRWHITLGKWMKNYLYIPLGGNRVDSKWRLYFNLWLVFLASGFWHGASWGFIIWGAYHGLFLVMERGFLLKVYKHIPVFIKVIFTFLVVMVGWVFFRSENLTLAFGYLSKMFSFADIKAYELLDRRVLFVLILAAVFSFVHLLPTGKSIQKYIYFPPEMNIWKHLAFTIPIMILLIISVASITSLGFNPFIYFRF